MTASHEHQGAMIDPQTVEQLQEQAMKAHTIDKAKEWRNHLGTTYNENLFKLVFNALYGTHGKLQNEYQADQNEAIRTHFLKDLEPFQSGVRENCLTAINLALQLFDLGVFHLVECRNVVLGPLHSQLPNVARMIQRQIQQQKADEEAKEQGENSRQKARVNGGDGDGARHNEGPSGKDMSNNAAYIDEDDEEELAPAYSINILYAATKCHPSDFLYHQQQATNNPTPHQRTLQQLFASHQDMRLSSLSRDTLELAGLAVLQIVEEATFAFVQRCTGGLSELEKAKLWAQLLSNDAAPAEITALPVPPGFPADKDGGRSVPELMAIAISTLRASFKTATPPTLRLVFARGMRACDALGDTRRHDALQRALQQLSWLIVSVEIKALQVFRSIAQRLDQISGQLYNELIHGPQGDYAAAGGNPQLLRQIFLAKRHTVERDMLQSHVWTFDGFKEPFQIEFKATLSRLTQSEE